MPALRPAASKTVKLATNPSLDHLLKLLEAVRNEFGPASGTSLDKLLARLSRHTFPDPASLIRLHEALLFSRAFPPRPSLIPRLEKLLTAFHERVEHLRRLGADMTAFDDFDTSGIAGTVMQDALNFD